MPLPESVKELKLDAIPTDAQYVIVCFRKEGVFVNNNSAEIIAKLQAEKPQGDGAAQGAPVGAAAQGAPVGAAAQGAPVGAAAQGRPSPEGKGAPATGDRAEAEAQGAPTSDGGAQQGGKPHRPKSSKSKPKPKRRS